MKIAQLSTCWLRTPPTEYGGTEMIVSLLTDQLVALGHEVTLCATGDSLTKAELWSWFDTPTSGYRVLDEVVHVVKAYEYLQQFSFDIIHNHTYYMGPALLSLVNTPSITTYHGAYEAAATAFQAAFSSTHRYVSLSRRQRQLLPEVNWMGTVYNAVDTSAFAFEAKKEDYLLFVGALLPWKGAHLAIQVARTLRQRLKIVGPAQQVDGPRQNLIDDYYRQEIAPYLDGHLIEYLGEVSSLHKIALYQRAKALLVPILWDEPFGLTMIEALSCGTPVIAFAKGAAPEIVVHGEVGFLVSDLDGMLVAINGIEKIAPLACRQYAEQYFHPRLMAQRYLDIYTQVVSAGKFSSE